MRIKPDCYPCFMHQVLNTSRLLGIPEEGQRALLAEAARTIAGVPPETPPPVVGGLVHAMVRRAAGSPDPFLDAKRADNRAMLAQYPEMREAVRLSADPLETALAFAAGGNAMDHGIAGAVDAAAGDFRCEPAVYAAFRERLERAESVLIVGDNAGEIVCDRLLVETLGRPVRYAVRGAPVINDALMEDAEAVGLTGVCEVFPSGSAIPGTVLADCEPRFIELFRSADLILSKGQGNYETLDGERGPLFFLLKAKCGALTGELGCGLGDLVLAPGADMRNAGRPAHML